MEESNRHVSNRDVVRVAVEVPPGHRHLRTTLYLTDGSTLTFQEATVANIVRAYVTLKTHPTKTRVILEGAPLPRRKTGFAEWQLLESPQESDHGK